jgi:DNA repair protein RecO (recombination protein O)
MLALPPFLTIGAVVAADSESLAAAFRLTGFFLHRHVYEPRGIQIAAAREGFIQAALKAVNSVALDDTTASPVLIAKH